ncbi:MAG: hypothetical protein HZB70_02985 [Candidatus Berkelbacteria bacterium]|nr:MAG: hypothetical protein HZB70_02985 [Candidatus Berkelbacteria bacterium]QQG51730.1 MAG: hypothetical protein HY845_00010 [Candidatus Berkelbacteria bacterium]
MWEGLSSRLKRLLLLMAAFGLIGLGALVPQSVTAADPPKNETCNTTTTGKAHEAGLKITEFTAQDTVDQTFDETGVSISLAFVTPKSVKKIDRVEMYAKDEKGDKTAITPTAVTRGKEGDKEVSWTTGASLRMKGGVYTFHTTITAKIEAITHQACAQTKLTQVELHCGKADSDLPFDKPKSVLRTDGDKDAPNKKVKFIRYATTGRRCFFTSAQLDFREGTKIVILKDEASETHLRSNTDYVLYYTGTSVATSGQPWHGFIAVDKQTGIFADVVFRRTAQASGDSEESIYSWNASVGRDATSGFGEWKVKLLLNLRELRGQKVQGFVTGKKREINIKADFDIDYAGSEAATKNEKFSGKQTTLPEFNESVAEMQLWCAYEGQGKDHLFVAAHKFDLATNPSDGKWEWPKVSVYSGSCIITSFLTLTNDGAILGDTPNYTAHPKYGITSDRTFEDALGNAESDTTDALYLGIINRGREDLWAADLEFKIDADTSKAVPDLNPIFTHRATTTDVYAGNPCGILSIVNELGLGVSDMLKKLLTCLLEGVFKGVAGFVEQFFQAVGGYSELSVPATVAVRSIGPPGGSSLTESVRSFIAPTAWAQPTPPVKTVKSPPADEIKKGGYEGALRDNNNVVVVVWKYARSLLNIVVVLALLAIAFANILHLNINTYAAKKMLPGLVLGVIGANASLLIIRFLADVTQAVSHLALEFAGVTTVASLTAAFPQAIGKQFIDVGITALVAGGAAIALGAGWAVLFVAIGIFIYFIFIIVAFCFAMLKRAVILYFLTMISPLAFLAYGVPQFQKYFFQWWDMFLRHLFVWPILLFGMAITVTISNLLGAGALLGSAWTVEGILSMALVLGAAHLTLHLPKMITKGTIDAANILKKTLAQAPRIAQGVQDTHQFFKGGGYERFKGIPAAMKKGQLEAQRLKLHDVLKEKAKKKIPLTPEEIRRYRELTGAAKQASKYYDDNFLKPATERSRDYKQPGWMKNVRGYTTLAGNPEHLQNLIKSRMDRNAKNDYIAAMTKTHRLPSYIRGFEDEAIVAKGLALDELKEARNMEELRDWFYGGLGDGHRKAVYNEGDASQNLMTYMKAAAAKAAEEKITNEKDPTKQAALTADKDRLVAREFERLRQKFGSIGAQSDMVKFIEKTLGTENRWHIHDLMKVSGYEKKMTEVAKGVRWLEEEGRDPLDLSMAKRKKVDPDGDRGVPTPDPPAARGATPPPFAGADPRRARQVAEDGLQGWVKQVFGQASQVAPHLNQQLESEIMESLHGLGALDPATFEGSGEAERLRTALIGAAGGNPMSNDQLTKEIFNSNAQGLVKLAEQVLQAGEVNRRGGTREAAESVARDRYNQSASFHNQAANSTANIDYNQLSKALSEAVASGNADLGRVIADHLGPELEKMTKALGKNFSPETLGKVAQEINRMGVDKIREIFAGRDQRSVSNVIARSIAKANDAHVPEPEELIVKVETNPAQGQQTTTATSQTEPEAESPPGPTDASSS